MRTENSPEFEARMKRSAKDEARKRTKASNQWTAIKRRWAKSGRSWLAMHECPFEALDHRYGLDGAIYVSDGKATALVTVKRRFGTPMFWKKQPEMVYRDGVICLEGGEVDPRPDLPKWFWKWELTDEFGSMTYAGGEETGKEEVGFVPTVWTFLPDPPSNGESP